MLRAGSGGRWLVPCLVSAVTLATFWPSLQGEFLNWDDDENFLHNPEYRGLGPAQLRWMFTTTHMGPYVPLAWLTLGADYLLWGLEPWGYHLSAVLFHTASAALLWAVARRLLGAALPSAPPGALAAGAAVAALFWAIHPLRVESVAWITERRDVVSGLPTLSSVLAYLRAWAGRAGDGRLARPWLGLAVVCYGLALLAKPTVVGLALVFLALDLHPLRRPGEGRRWPQLLREKLPFLAIAGLAAGLSLATSQRLLTDLATLSIPQRLALSAYGLVFYLGKTLLPWDLSPLYTLFHPVDPWAPRFVAAGATVVLAGAAIAAGAARWPAGVATAVAVLALALPTLGLLHNGPQIAADRYTYAPAMAWSLLPGAGVAWLATAAAAGRLRSSWWRTARVAIAAGLAGLCLLTIVQERVWRDSVSLWRHAARVEPESDIPVFYLGWALAAGGRHDEARRHFERALARAPAAQPALRAHLLLHLGTVQAEAGELAGAERSFREALRIDPHHPIARIRLGLALLALERREEGERLLLEAAGTLDPWPRYRTVELRQAVERVPLELAEARGRLAFALGVQLHRHGAAAPAAEQYRLAVALLPGHAAAWNNLGVLEAQQGRRSEALAAFLRALAAQPGHGEACRNGRRLAAELRQAPAALAACPGGTG
jgi:tetratricopeptide (TPR) repeat protein